MISFVVPGEPVGKARPRFTKAGRTYTPGKTKDYETRVAFAAHEAMFGFELFDGPLRLWISAEYPVPASWSKRKKSEAVWHTGKPDADNLAKAISDAMNGVVYRDDAQIASLVVEKKYADRAQVRVVVEPIRRAA